MNEKIALIQKEKRTAQIMVGVCIAGLLGCLILVSRRSPISLILFTVIFLFYLLVFRRQSKKYQQTIKKATLEECFRSSLKDISYEPKNGLEKERITQSHLLPVVHPENLLIRDTVKGTFQFLPAVLSDVTTDFFSSRTTRQGGAKEFLDFLSGNWFEIQLKAPIPYSCVVWSRDLVPESARTAFFEGYQNLDMYQDEDFRKVFHLYSDQEQEFTLPEEAEKALLRLAGFTPGKVAAEFSGNMLRVFIKDRFLYTYAVRPRVDVTPQILQHNQYPEISYILRVPDAVIKGRP